ncbi:MAG: DUF2851 family protein [Chloroflexi bacterium]|nr:DUF2851 family protein [Chloroflexota bacterium]
MTRVRAGPEQSLESQVARWWRGGVLQEVVTNGGRSLRVLYPGRPSPQVGPDFRDVLLATEDGEFIRGDVEIHLRQRDWAGHGHHRDPRYRGVVLHVFLRGGNGVTFLETGAPVPEVLLEAQPRPTHLETPPDGHPTPGEPAVAAPLERLRALPEGELGRVLDEAGERRFLSKASTFVERLRGGDSEQELFAGLMEALGYSQNRATMLLLARRLTLSQVKELANRHVHHLALEALLLGAAGLLPHQRGLCLPHREEVERSKQLEGLWRSAGQPCMLSGNMWDRSSTRPHNQPQRRLVGGAAIVARFLKNGLVEGLGNALMRGLREAERSLRVESTGFWEHHLDYHLPVGRAPALIGAGRARDMVVNILLPFFYGISYLLEDREMGRRSLGLYHLCPPGQDNEVTREVKGLLLPFPQGKALVNSARRQQGLLHLYNILRGKAR